MPQMLKIDGSAGGGQIVRTALAFSTLTGIPFKVTNIRANRKPPGLKTQHTYCVKALQDICGATATGAELGSKELEYHPGKISSKDLTIDIGTAGSITLLLQAVLLPSIFSDKSHTLTIKGGTDTQWSMPFDYLKNILIPKYQHIVEIEVKLVRRGYYPRGGGEVQLRITPKYKRNDFETYKKFHDTIRKPLSLVERGKLERIEGVSHASAMLKNARVAERQADSAEAALKSLGVPISIDTHYDETLSKGSGITLWAVCGHHLLGGDALGKQGKPSEEVGKEAAKMLRKEIGREGAVDSHLADNLIPLLALCGGSMKPTQITNHTKTNMSVVEEFLGKTFKEKDGIISA